MEQAKANIILHKNQQVVHESQARFKTIKAGKRFGKTKWALFAIAQKAFSTPNGVFWYTAPTYRQAKSIAWHELKWIIPERYIKRQTENELTLFLTNGTRIELKGEDNMDSLRGIGIDGLVRDEVALNPQGDYCWNAILRGQLKLGAFAYHISSPNPHGRNWYTNFCEDTRIKQQNGDKDFAFWHFNVYDNPTIPKDEIDKWKDGMPESTWNLEYMALESEFAGQVYSEFSEERNIGVYEGNRVLFVYRGLDWGLDHPTVCLWAKLDLETKTVYVYDEYVRSGLTTSENAKVIIEKTGSIPVEASIIDPSSDRRDPNTKRTIRDEWCRWGVPCVPGDRRERGIDITKMFLKRGMVKIDPKCKTLIYELRNFQWGDKTGDDAVDSLRYMLTFIHDRVNGMNTFEQLTEVKKELHRPEMSVFDTQAYKYRNKEQNNWLLEEVL